MILLQLIKLLTYCFFLLIPISNLCTNGLDNCLQCKNSTTCQTCISTAYMDNGDCKLF